MDDMLGAMLDIDESVKAIIDWIEANGGWERNALYVTADHGKCCRNWYIVCNFFLELTFF
jgi:alkaline phosphatase